MTGLNCFTCIINDNRKNHDPVKKVAKAQRGKLNRHIVDRSHHVSKGDFLLNEYGFLGFLFFLRLLRANWRGHFKDGAGVVVQFLLVSNDVLVEDKNY